MSGIRLRAGAVLAVGVLAAAMASCASSSTPAPSPSATGSSSSAAHGDFAGLVDISGGRKMYLECHGSGSPTVILQSGFFGAGDVWSLADAHPPAVAPGVAQFTRVCTYDRPGAPVQTVTTNGTVAPATSNDEVKPSRSTPVPPMPRNTAELVTELHELLATAGVPGPYVMVGHSLGGALSTLYARTYPDQVTGLVTVEAPMPPERNLLTPEQWERLRHLPPLPRQGLPPDVLPGYTTEAYDLGLLFDQIEAAPPLRPMPVIVLVRGKDEELPDPLPSGVSFTAEDIAAQSRIWPQAQAEFAASIPGAQLITVPDTTHNIHEQRPDAVIQAIRQVVAQ